MFNWVAGIGARAWSSLAIAGAAVIAVSAIFFRGRQSGLAAARQAELESRIRGTEARADADTVANTVAHLVDELRRRGWVRDVAPDNSRSNRQ